MRSPRALALAVFLVLPTALHAQEAAHKAEPMKASPPKELPASIAGNLAEEGFRIVDAQGKPFAEVWPRKSVPVAAPPSGPQGNVLYPVLESGALLGAVRYLADGQDYRDQTIEPGVYTIRYGLEPVNGDHLGVSPYRDFALVVPAGKETSPDPLSRKDLESRSAEAAGSNHPAVLMLFPVPPGKNSGEVIPDQEKRLEGLMLTLPLEVSGQKEMVPLPVQVIFSGSAPV